jgi:hypothetical protein
VTRRLHRMQKHKFIVMCPSTLFMGSTTGPPEHKKIVHQSFMPWTHLNAMHDTQITLDEEKFGVRCPSAHFMVSAPGSPKDEKECIDVSCPGRPKTHYVTRRSYQMQKHKFSESCPVSLFPGPVAGSPKHEK